MSMHPHYRSARKRLANLITIHPSLFDQTLTIGARWREALAKDDTGRQCVRYVDDLIERMTPMRR